MEASKKFRCFLACDHAGFELKEAIKASLTSKNMDFEDLGVYTADRCDYPDLSTKLALKIQEKKENRGILACGSGVGISIAANKFRGIRCGLVHDQYSLSKALEVYCNVISLGGRVLGEKLALSLVEEFLRKTDYVEDEKYKEIMLEIEAIESKYL